MRFPNVAPADWAAAAVDTPLHGTARFWSRTLARLKAMRAAARQRRDLLGLDDRTLRDIGVSRTDVAREAGRRFWDIDLDGSA
jgi:uncharacterized protein YjiS (DUF1127 family)